MGRLWRRGQLQVLYLVFIRSNPKEGCCVWNSNNTMRDHGCHHSNTTVTVVNHILKRNFFGIRDNVFIRETCRAIIEMTQHFGNTLLKVKITHSMTSIPTSNSSSTASISFLWLLSADSEMKNRMWTLCCGGLFWGHNSAGHCSQWCLSPVGLKERVTSSFIYYSHNIG